jgi:cation transporter-like permease
VVQEHERITRKEHNEITRKNLISSLATGLAIGIVAGIPIGWFVHQVYAQQRLAQILLCHERNRSQPAAVVESICGARY